MKNSENLTDEEFNAGSIDALLNTHVGTGKSFEAVRGIIGKAQAELDLAEAGGRHTPQERLHDVITQLKFALLECDNQGRGEDPVFEPNWDNQPPGTTPLISWLGIPVLETGNISMITSPAGSGKSSMCETHCSAAIITELSADNMGIEVSAEQVLYVDTERSRGYTHESWRRYTRRAGINPGDDIPTKVLWKNIRGISTSKERAERLWQEISQLPENSLLLLDGIGDLVADVNDTTACTEMVSRLCAVVHNRNIGALVTLHNNPMGQSKEKARGVLGSELLRKSQSVSIIEKEGEIKKLTTNFVLGKNRAGSDDIAIYFKWDNEKQMHVSCNPEQVITPNKLQTQRLAILKMMGEKTWIYTDLKTAIMDDLGKGDRTAERLIRDLTLINKIKKNGSGYAVDHVLGVSDEVGELPEKEIILNFD